MPESAAEDGEQLFRRVHNSMRGTALGPDEQRLRLSGGIAELLHGDTPASLFERADAALYRAKGLGKDRADIAQQARPAPTATCAGSSSLALAAQRDEGVAAGALASGRRVETTTLARGPSGLDEEHGALGSGEPRRTHGRRAGGEDPCAVRGARGRDCEPADHDRRTAAASHGEHEAARRRGTRPARCSAWRAAPAHAARPPAAPAAREGATSGLRSRRDGRRLGGRPGVDHGSAAGDHRSHAGERRRAQRASRV